MWPYIALFFGGAFAGVILGFYLGARWAKPSIVTDKFKTKGQNNSPNQTNAQSNKPPRKRRSRKEKPVN
jgi:hypothetical protein